jgi:hypothetical protein
MNVSLHVWSRSTTCTGGHIYVFGARELNFALGDRSTDPPNYATVLNSSITKSSARPFQPAALAKKLSPTIDRITPRGSLGELAEWLNVPLQRWARCQRKRIWVEIPLSARSRN